MSKLLINQSTLSSIGDAIRTKGGTTDLIPVTGLANAILDLEVSGGGGSVSGLTLTVSGDARYFNNGGYWDNIISSEDNSITFNGISNGRALFKKSKLEAIPDIVFNNVVDIGEMFYGCSNLKTLPNLSGYANNITWFPISGSNTEYVSECVCVDKMFFGCNNLREIDTNYLKKLFQYKEGNTSPYAYGGCLPFDLSGRDFKNRDTNQLVLSSMFADCYSLRKHCDLKFFLELYEALGLTPGYYNMAFYNCYALDEITDYILPQVEIEVTSNQFTYFNTNCYRLSKLTFEVNTAINGAVSAKYVNWSNQTINLSSVGYGPKNKILGYNSGITADKEVYDNATYQALKDDPDWFTQDAAYSRYNKTSALETINSLPSISGNDEKNNIIKFNGEAGSATDGGAINTLTPVQIAVATNKGWTVTFA